MFAGYISSCNCFSVICLQRGSLGRAAHCFLVKVTPCSYRCGVQCVRHVCDAHTCIQPQQPLRLRLQHHWEEEARQHGGTREWRHAQRQVNDQGLLHIFSKASWFPSHSLLAYSNLILVMYFPLYSCLFILPLGNVGLYNPHNVILCFLLWGVVILV